VRYALVILPLLFLGVAIWLWGHLAERAARLSFDTGILLLGLGFVLALTVVGLLVYMAYCAFTMRYTLGLDELKLRCGMVRHVVPVASITRVYGPGDLFQGGKVVEVKWQWAAGLLPGYTVGEGVSPQLGRVVSVATVPANAQVYVVTQGVTFGLSPQNSMGFMKQLNQRIDTDPSMPEEGVRTEMSLIGSWGAAIWSDRLVRTLFLTGLALNALLFIYLSLVFDGLPQRLALHWNAQAQVDRIGDPMELLRLPVFALAAWLANVIMGWLVKSRERAATLFLLGGSVAAQVVFAAGAVSIVVRAV
jgi:hypothetical protein